ncbi:citrate synthase [Stackebrandtia endophytica]|uniref:citrate synthase (unknown stereospecificity) n=1 Tax=Stackebrandtia endophytica TaxID=1496996 RepID=A0A543B0W2_9ACTN|nr:citryl-CoA lyase [Stackebrandtia endophytica]TQL78464.1 citrate synthase [Stackebrandtia endophytica]
MTYQSMGEASRDAIIVRGHDLTGDLIGGIGFTDMIMLELTGRLPDEAGRAVLDAVLVALTEHGLTPSAMVARLTDLGAPDAMQGAVAAGLLGAGDRFLGAIDGCARLLQEWPNGVDDSEHAATIVAATRAEHRRVPGLGHPTHTDGDPRTDVLYRVADTVGLDTTARDRFGLVQAAAQRATGRPLPINVDGAAAVLLTQVGLPWQACRGIALVARSAGLIGHLLDEQRQPTASAIWASAEKAVPYQPPDVPG